MSKCQCCDKVFERIWWVDVVDDDVVAESQSRRAVVCGECLEKMDADMWVSRKNWESLNPVVSYGRLNPVPEWH